MPQPMPFSFTMQQGHSPLPLQPQPVMPPPPASGGVIFLCDPRTEEECLQRGLFGLPATQTAIVRAIVPEATLLFLFNVRAPSHLCACTRLAQFYF